MSHLCALCMRERDEREPAFKRYQLGPLDGWLCSSCAKPIAEAMTQAVAARVEQLRIEARRATIADRQVQRRLRRRPNMEVRLARAQVLERRLVSQGVPLDAARHQASVEHGVRVIELAATDGEAA